MFISGRSYGNNLKYKAFYVCMSFILMALFSTILTTKPAFAVDNPGSNPDSNPHYINKGSVKCPKNYLPKPENDKSMWWGCSGKTILGERGEFTGDVDPVFTCATGWKADFKIKTENQFQGSGLGRSVKRVTFRLGQCVEDKESVVEKNAEALANKAGQDNLVTLISPKIEASPWYLGLSDANKVAAGCKYQSLPGAPSRASEKGWFCDDAAKKKLTRMLIGTCIAIAVKDVAKRTNGDTGSSAMDAVFTSCLVKNSGVDAASINKVAWDDIKKDVDISEKKDEDGEPESSCSGDLGSLGWLICPSMSLGGKLADAGYNSVSMFLDISPDIFNDNPELGGAKQAWNFFRDIANVVFVLLFLWVIFSQISNVGVSNYGIKKILPKLILGAILINLSFYICQLAVDLSNILGYALKGVLEGASLRAETSDTGLGGGFVAVLTGALGLVGAPLFAFLTVSIPMLIWTLLSIAAALLILVFRQAAVILLIAISPIAFAAWLLPNTESLFKKWVSAFKGLLVVFPVVSLMYGSGKLAGAVLSNSSGGIMQFVAMCAPIVPLIATPFVIKSSLNSLGSLGAKLSNNGLMNFPSNRLKDNVMNKSRFADARKSFDRYSAKKLAESRSGNSKLQNLKNSNNKFASTLGRVMSFGTTLDNTEHLWGFGRKLGLSDAAINYQEAYDKNAMEKAERALTYKYGGDAAKALNDKNADKYIRIAAVNQLKGQGTYGADKIAEYLNAGGKVDSVSMAKSLTDMKGSHAGVAKAGSEALQELQKEGGLSEINFSSDQFKNFTASGVSELSNKDIAGQSAKAIEKSNITADKATEILSNDILYSSANDAVISALKKKGGKRIIPQTPQDNQNNQQGNNSQQSSQNGQQGNSSSQQSSQNNQQNNSSSGG